MGWMINGTEVKSQARNIKSLWLIEYFLGPNYSH